MSKRDNPAIAARERDRRAREELARAHLPLVYNVIGRALGGHPDVEDVVRETMLRAIGDVSGPRQPDSDRARILTIALHRIAAHRQLTETAAVPATPATGFEELAILRLQLTGERRQVAEASRWLDRDDRDVLALWWQEAAGHVTRADVATAMDTGLGYAAGRIQRMRVRLDNCRILVAALEAQPRCPVLSDTIRTWDGEPGPLWRKRIDGHVRDCRTCMSRLRGETPVDRLLARCAMVPVPLAFTAPVADGATVAVAPKGRSGVKALVASVAAAAVVAGGVAAYAAIPPEPQPAARPAAVLPSPSTIRSGTAIGAASPTATAPDGPGCAGEVPAARWAAWPMPTEKTARYRDQGDGTVRDTVTCLDWQRVAAPDPYTFTGATAYCASLRLDGGGWHLPTRIELTSIVDASRSGPAISSKAFPGTPAEPFWTSTPRAVAKNPLRAWTIDFGEGTAGNGARRTGELRVRCARSASTGTGKPAYRIAGGMVTDPQTGLTWQRATPSAVVPASTAAGYCAALTLGGREWRLPAMQELATTVDDSRAAPSTDPATFPVTITSGWYWTATRAAPQPAGFWALNYLEGFTDYRKITTGYVRCVS